MPKRIKNFQNFVLNEYRSSTIDESYIGQKFSEFKNWAKNLVTSIKDGIIKLIPSGLKKGAPIAGVFDPADGSVVSQIRKFYAGTEFANTNPISVYESESIEEARIPLEYTGEDQSEIFLLLNSSQWLKNFIDQKKEGEELNLFLFMVLLESEKQKLLDKQQIP
jgi:hypothetical protein